MAANRIRALRKEAGFNQKELGKRLGVVQTTVSAWEIGRNEPDNEVSHKMAQLFGCSIGYLMGYEAESPHRGLSDAEWNKFIQRKMDERRAEDAERFSDDAFDEEGLEEHLRAEQVRDWENSERSVFPETIEIDAILERTDADGRKRAVQVMELMFPHSGE